MQTTQARGREFRFTRLRNEGKDFPPAFDRPVGYEPSRLRATTFSSRIGFTPSKIGSTVASTT